MRRTWLRACLVMAVCGLGALWVSAGAFAAYTPKLVVSLSTADVSAPVDVTLDLSQAAGDSQTSRFTIFVPLGFNMDLTAASGTSVGSAAIGVGGGAPATGTITADNPATHTADTCSPGTNQAVWLVSAGGVTFPVYVNATTGGDASLGPFKLVACFGATRPTETALTVKKVFTNPSGGNFEVAFTAAATPVDASGQPSPAGAVYAYGIVRVPVLITVTPRFATSSGKTIVTGIVQETSLLYGLPGGKVEIFGGATADSEKSLGTVKTNSKGQFIWSQAGSSLKSFHAALVPVVRDAKKYDCNPTYYLLAITPGGCVNALIGPVTVSSDSATVKTTKR